MPVEPAIRRLRSLFLSWGESDYIGEPVSVLAHSLQAAELARQRGGSEEVQLAALLHDIGHLLGLEAGFAPGMDGCGTPRHEHVAADFLTALGVPDEIAWLDRRHVDAKRYLCGRSPAYLARLSEASRTTLRHQGGPMSEQERVQVEADPRWPGALALRAADEAAKEPGRETGPLDLWLERLAARMARSPVEGTRPWLLSSEQLRAWDQDGALLVRGGVHPDTMSRLGAMAEEVAALPRGQGPWMVHHERSATGDVRLCRVENFCKHHEAWGALCFGLVADLVGQVWRQPALLFKDKLNFKGPGGAGFLCHQDATAYATEALARRHVSALVAIDAARPENGALQIARGRHQEGVLPHVAGVVRPEVEAAMMFQVVNVEVGDIVLFDSYLPHRSGPNATEGWRRAAYLTFNLASEGDLHAAYYAHKRATMAEGAISLNLDFAGEIVDA